MSPFDQRPPSKPGHATGAPPAETEIVATSGVKVIVRDHQPPAWLAEAQEEREPVPAPVPVQRAVIRPPQEPGWERQAFFRRLDAEYGEFILKLLLARRDVLPESANDLRQGALEVLFKEADDHGLPRDVECYLGGVLRNLVRNHKRKWSPDIDRGADGRDVACAASGPEAEAEQAERWSRLMRHMSTLSKEEAEAVQCVDVLGMTLAEAGKELGRHPSSVAQQVKRAREKLEDLARASDEATELGLRRRPRG
jgi:RNA polymerase sigma factor (sigma-70 family)